MGQGAPTRATGDVLPALRGRGLRPYGTWCVLARVTGPSFRNPSMEVELTRARLRSGLAAIPVVLGAIMFTATAAHAAITPTTNNAAGATALANAMLADPSVLTSASFATVPPNGTPHGTSTAMSFFPTHGSTFAIMTTGNVNLADDPNNAPNTGEPLGGGPVRGNTDLDVSILKLDLNVPAGVNCARFNFAFYSDEFPEFVGSSFNDAFIAELDSSTWTTSGSTITAPNNFAFDANNNVISINAAGAASMTAANAAGTTSDGATPLLSAATVITPGAHSIYLSIFDQGDQFYDSAVFLDNLVLITVADPANNCRSGAQLVESCPVPNPLPPGTIVATPGTITVGTAGNDVIVGTAGDDRIAGLGGNDTIYGLGGNDKISGGDGNDRLCGGAGNDELAGSPGADELFGGDGADDLAGDVGADKLYGELGDDRLAGGPDTDECTGDGQPGDQTAACEVVRP